VKDTNDKIIQIPIDSISDPDTPIRTRANESAIYDLADSIRDVGIIQPLLVRSRGDRYEVIAGHRRLIAARVVGLLTVPCILSDADDTECDVLRLHENLAREDINIIDQARFLERIMKKLDLTVSAIAQTVKRSESYIRDRLAILKWPKEVVEALDNQKLKFEALKWLAKIDDDSERRRLLDAAVRSGITSRVAYDWYCRWKAGTMPKTSPPPTTVEPKTGEKIEYFTSRCRICGEPIKMGEEEVIYTHRECIEEIESSLKPPA